MDNPAATCINRVGFRRKDESGTTEWIVLPESFKSEVVRGFSERRAGLERWLDHPGPNGEPRRERVARALRI